MRIAVPKEIRDNEYRVAITPTGVTELVAGGHQVFVQRDAGAGARHPDQEYLAAGAQILESADDIWAVGDLLIKIKKPVVVEFARMRSNQLVLSFLHLWDGTACIDALQAAGTSSIAMEEVTDTDGSLPFLTPMSQISGRLAPQIAAGLLLRHGSNAGAGLALGGITGADPASVVVIGGGVAGREAARVAADLGAQVTVLDTDFARLKREAHTVFRGCRLVPSNPAEIARAVAGADVVIGAVRVRGQNPPVAPTVVTREMVSRMREGSVLIDLSIDHGGCFERSRLTSHEEPTFTEDGVVYYCVPNIPTSVPVVATQAITRVTLPFVVSMADNGVREALRADPVLASGLNTLDGELVNPWVAAGHGYPHRPLREVLR